MDPFASTSDVETIWGAELVDPELGRVEARLAQASAIIREADPLVGGLTIDQRVAASESFAAVVKGVVVDMVHRLLMNPQGRLEVAVDDARVRYDASVSTGQLYLSAAERQTLFGGRIAAGSKAFTIALGSPVFQGPRWL